MNRDAPVCLTAYSTSRLQIPNHRRFKTLSALTLNLRAFAAGRAHGRHGSK